MVGLARSGISAFHPIDKDLSLGTPALIAKAAQTRGMDWVAGEDGSTFAGGDLLVGIEAEDREIAEAAHAA